MAFASLRTVHAKSAHARQADHLTGRHAADQGIAVIAATRLQRGISDRFDVVVHEQAWWRRMISARSMSWMQRCERCRDRHPIATRRAASSSCLESLRLQSAACGARRRAGEMTIQRDDDDADSASNEADSAAEVRFGIVKGLQR